jgi:hypothetical protein
VVVGSPLVGAWIAQIAFWLLIAFGINAGALNKKQVAGLVALWLVGYLGLPRLAWWTWPFVTSWVAVLDIVLVFIVFKGDVRIT